MARTLRIFRVEQPKRPFLGWGDAVVLFGIMVLLYVGVRAAFQAPASIKGPTISLSLEALPWYAAFSLLRMFVAYAMSMLFTLVYGYLAACNRRAEIVLMPLLDVLQSVPILSFLPVVLLSFSAILPEMVAAELASVVLIFTSQVWNLTFAWYQSLTTVPSELREAAQIFRLNVWFRLKTLELPFATISLVWNSMMSWAGGWFFLMAAEIFTVGNRDFRLPGLGAYLQEAANQGDIGAIAWGIGTLVFVIVALDQLMWRPLLCWADRFKLETVDGDAPPKSWFYDALREARLLDWLSQTLCRPLGEYLDGWFMRRFPVEGHASKSDSGHLWIFYLLLTALGVTLLYGGYRASLMLLSLSLESWWRICVGGFATLLRVMGSLLVALAWTVPVGVLIGTNPILAAWLRPAVQIVASVPATALFPVFLLLIVGLPGGLNLAAILLMLMGTQWYLLFNVIAGASTIPQDLRYTAALLQLSRWDRWRKLTLPALFPHMITGAITASGGAWNASIVAEHVEFAGQTLRTSGLGALIAEATAAGNYPLLLAATLVMVLTVVMINRSVWQRLYRLAEERYRME
jgi:NitT/TauT family transport system permease protein